MMKVFGREMKVVRALALVAGVAALGACSGHGMGQKEGFGTLLGAAAGGLAGSQIGSGSGQLIATGAGVLLGAFVGNSIGQSLDKADRLYAARTQDYALERLPTGQSATWSNPDSGHYGEVRPTATYQEPSGRYCREFTHTVYIGGHPEEAYGRACRQPDGSWEIVS